MTRALAARAVLRGLRRRARRPDCGRRIDALGLPSFTFYSAIYEMSSDWSLRLKKFDACLQHAACNPPLTLKSVPTLRISIQRIEY
ncbi:hypothetical protein EVAR_85269_1 [Eumeta japonica]|uniref:Uncharacterized protein n=1 Tax=Eumeta variegata TaxID=151549 RepID=A0A4C1V7A4_EUMVA|nr:hypothetical protein EVAR_85269_1 [Eumeta japonica]